MLMPDLSVRISRLPETKNYRVDLLSIKDGKPDEVEKQICQTLPEVFACVARFEAKHLTQFENAIEYEKTDWRALARQNQLKGA